MPTMHCRYFAKGFVSGARKAVKYPKDQGINLSSFIPDAQKAKSRKGFLRFMAICYALGDYVAKNPKLDETREYQKVVKSWKKNDPELRGIAIGVLLGQRCREKTG